MPVDLTTARQALAAYRYAPRDVPGHSRWASVAAILRRGERDRVSVLVIRRSEHPDDPWSGHMAMPGGRHEPEDPTLQYTAERETLEEVGIDLRADGRLLGRLDDVTAVARGRRLGLTIAPFVYELVRPAGLILSDEVAEVLWVPLSDLSTDAFRSTLEYRMSGRLLDLPCWRWHGRVIWGLTYRMLETLLRVINTPVAYSPAR